MKKTIKKVINLSFEEKTVLLSIISVCFNFIFGVGKIIMSFFFGVFFLASGIVNILLGFAKLTCYIGIKRKELSFTKAKTIVSILIFIAGIEYTAKGEKKHLNLEESDFNYKDLLKAFKDFNIKGAIVCESPNIEDDAKLLKDFYLSL